MPLEEEVYSNKQTKIIWELSRYFVYKCFKVGGGGWVKKDLLEFSRKKKKKCICISGIRKWNIYCKRYGMKYILNRLLLARPQNFFSDAQDNDDCNSDKRK